MNLLFFSTFSFLILILVSSNFVMCFFNITITDSFMCISVLIVFFPYQYFIFFNWLNTLFNLVLIELFTVIYSSATT